jgi:photosystem II stability/assembly factor-like uncharacterized protein
MRMKNLQTSFLGIFKNNKVKITTLLLILILLKPQFTFSQWMQTNGPEGISITSFINVDDTTLLCGSHAKGIFRSSDHGDTWIVSNTGIANKWVESFTKDSIYIYAGTFGEGVYRSSDNGHTWFPANTGMQTQAVSCMMVAGGFVFAGTVGNGLYRSADQGNTWVDVNDNLLDLSYILSMVYVNGRLMVEADNYIFYSFTLGNNWNVDQGITSFYTIDNFFQHGDTLLASTGIILFRSTDGGQNWSQPNIMAHSLIGFDNIGDTIYAGSTDGMYMSTDFGSTFTFTPSSDLRHGARSLDDFVISGPNFLYGYQEIGVYKSQNGGAAWQQIPLNQFLVGSTIDDAMIFDNGIVYTGTHTNGVYSTSDQGNTWTKIGTPNNLDTLSNEVVFDMLHVGQNILLAGGCGAGMFRSANNGATWTHITAGLPPVNGTFTCVKTLAVCGPNVLAALINGVYYSIDSGITWLPTNLTTSNILQTGGFAVRGNIACVGVIGTPSISVSGIYRSTDFGVTWTMSQNVPDIETMATGGNHMMYAGELFTSYVSYDDGLTWGGLGLGAAFSILAWDNYAFIGNNDGVYFSTNYGSSWALVNQGFDPYPNNVVMGLTRDSTFVYAGTERNGAWRRPLSDFGITTGVASSQIDKNLLSAFPNPSHGKIFFQVDESLKNTSIEIYNSAGAMVRKIPVATERFHAVDLSVLPSGIYSAMVSDGSQLFSVKFILADD